jgi:hypothetical protein
MKHKAKLACIVALAVGQVQAQDQKRPFIGGDQQQKRTLETPAQRREREYQERLKAIRDAVDAQKLTPQKLKDQKQPPLQPVRPANQDGPNWNEGQQEAQVQWLTSKSNPIQIISKTPFGENTYNFQVKNVSTRSLTFTVWKVADYEAKRFGSKITLDPGQIEEGNALFKWLPKNEAFVYQINK